MTAQDENLISLLTNMVIKSPQNNRFSSSPLPPISEVNRGRSEVNKPSRCSSFTQQPNVKGQRVLGVITSLPTYVCVCGVFFCEIYFKLQEFRTPRAQTQTQTQMCPYRDTPHSLSLRVCLKNLDNCSRFQPSTQDCLHRLLNNEIKPSHRGVKQNIYRGGERQTGVEVVVESEKRKKHEIISSVGNKGKEGNLVGMKMKNS